MVKQRRFAVRNSSRCNKQVGDVISTQLNNLLYEYVAARRVMYFLEREFSAILADVSSISTSI